jgi:hypothetical protein
MAGMRKRSADVAWSPFPVSMMEQAAKMLSAFLLKTSFPFPCGQRVAQQRVPIRTRADDEDRHTR